MLFALAQLHCAIQTAELPPGESITALPEGGVAHVVRYQNALTGEELAVQEAAALTPIAFGPDGAALAVTREVQVDPAQSRVRRAFRLPASGPYRLRVEDSSRYFGCEAELPPEPLSERRVTATVVPRIRDVALQVQVSREGTLASLTEQGLSEVELRPDAPFERAVEVRPGLCTGERPAQGSFWCVRLMGERADPVDLVARAPGYGLARVRLSPLSSERVVVLTARYEGHLTPSATVRLGAGAGVMSGGGATFHAALEVASGSATGGRTCPLSSTCVRLVAHVGAAHLPYNRDTVLRGPGTLETADGTTEGTLSGMELGGGVLVVPPGTGDRFRVMLLASGLLAARGEERDVEHRLLLSPATTLFGGVAELLAGFRLFDGWALHAGARVTFMPAIGSAGRRFSLLGDAPVEVATVSLLHLALTVGLGVEL